MVSTASFDSLAEEPLPPVSPSVVKGAQRPPKNRPPSLDPIRRNARKLRVLDDQRDSKRRKIIDEFYETERSYVEGLELIYSVSNVRCRRLLHCTDYST